MEDCNIKFIESDDAFIEKNGEMVFNEGKTFYEMDEVTIISYFYLMNDKDTVDHICCGFNPYINARGLVYIPKKGIYDCRDTMKMVLPVKDAYGLKLSAVEGKNSVKIKLGYPFWNLKLMQWDYSKVVYYTYDLETKTLSEE